MPKQPPIVPLPRLAGLPVRDLGRGLRVVEAASLRARLLGVAGLAELDPRVGLSLRTGSIHTFGVRFALDLLWFDAEARLLRIDRDVRPARIRACRGARSVVEVAAGSADAFAAALGSRS